MCTAMDSVEVIIVSSDEDEPKEEEVSVLFVEAEPVHKNDLILCSSGVEEDLVVTFSRRADILPHARYDCPIQPFMATECEISAPVHNNQLMCEQCFCYICDKLASQCKEWSSSGVCHCNSHKKSTFWNNQRNSSLLGGLQTFNLTLCEIDSHLRHAEMLLQRFKEELSVRFSTYLRGKPAEEYCSTGQGRVHDYTPVYECVGSFLDLAERQDSRAGAIMLLGAAEAFVRHYPVSSAVTLQTPMSNAAEARTQLINRVISWLQRQMVMGEFTAEFTQKLQEFYKKLSLPAQLKGLKNSLCVRPWDDVLLGSVLRGQNVCGYRKERNGKKDVLLEHISVVQLRTEKLQHQGRYKELCRYLRVVQTDDPKIFHQVLDLTPFFLCLDGQLSAALQNLLTSQSSRLSPHLFLSYLHIFKTATAPVQILHVHSDLCSPSAAWKPIPGAVPLKRVDLVKFALRAQAFCSDIVNDCRCWISVLSLVSSPARQLGGLLEPSAEYLEESKDLVKSLVLQSKNTCSFLIPRHVLKVYPDQALLLLLTEALVQRIQARPFHPVLPVLLCFQNNVWALRWLWDSLSSSERLSYFITEVTQELDQSTDKSLDFLRMLIPPSRHLDQLVGRSGLCRK
ncbi:uncharacterized protein zgc:112980 [Boleophthalmus pectinirostris]|uniref:uncharacterized protein zgc:112980 n=1 Tax=Boleophthalmus pectinirostris TaxID=150288 RepID=UPI002431ACCD|nr:uncharacterized protein zgc:112980 [Boleophthalmus pectinirostris]XP_055013743.1 uncharacterized protein zgc:112980 [Boleophthalmus pectinirostris]